MKFTFLTTAKTFAVLITVVFGMLILTVNSKSNLVRAEESSEATFLAGGSDIYNQSCASCHGADGKAQTARGKRKGATDLTKSAISNAKGIKVISSGRGSMPGFKDGLSPDEINSVMAYIRGFRK